MLAASQVAAAGLSSCSGKYTLIHRLCHFQRHQSIKLTSIRKAPHPLHRCRAREGEARVAHGVTDTLLYRTVPYCTVPYLQQERELGVPVGHMLLLLVQRLHDVAQGAEAGVDVGGFSQTDSGHAGHLDALASGKID